MQSPSIEHSPESMRRSAYVFSAFLILTLITISFDNLPKQLSMGVLWSGTGLLMMLLPPAWRVPKAWLFCVFGFIILSLLGFLPREWFSVSSWRLELEALGCETGSTSFVQPLVAAEGSVGFTIMALSVLYLMGHAIQTRIQQLLSLVFCLFMAIWIILALIAQKEGEIFGFFVNRNHTATLLAMTAFVGIGSLAQAIRHRHMILVALHTPCILLTLWVIFAASISRAGIIITGTGLVLWFVISGVGILRTNAGKMLILLVIAIIGTYIIEDSTAKLRLNETVANWSGDSISENAIISEKGFTNDIRYRCYRDTISMIRSEPWTGVGPQMFEFVFPQHMDFVMQHGENYWLHPESDWLQMVAEVGLPAVICLISGIFFVLLYSFRNRNIGKCRLLRNGCLVAAVLLLLHGMLDVPGHKPAIALVGILFLSLSIQGIALVEKSGWRKINVVDRVFWRSIGFAILLLGALLVVNQASNKAFLPSSKILKLDTEANKLCDLYFEADVEAVSKEQSHLSPPADELLDSAISHFVEASKILPLCGVTHNDIGFCAATRENDIYKKHFLLHLLLNPKSYCTCYDQAILWADVEEIIPLAKLAMERAARADVHSTTKNNTKRAFLLFLKHLHSSSDKIEYAKGLLDIAADNQDLLMMWVTRVSPAELDQLMPNVLTQIARAQDRKSLFDIWNLRGSRKIIDDYMKKNPDLEIHSK